MFYEVTLLCACAKSLRRSEKGPRRFKCFATPGRYFLLRRLAPIAVDNDSSLLSSISLQKVKRKLKKENM